MTEAELERLALGCVFAGFRGHSPPDWLRRRADEGLAGVVLFARHNVESRAQVRALCDGLHAERAELVVATDEEGGDVTRLEAREGSSYPGNLALGAVDDAELTERVAAALAGDLRDAGIDLDLAPVADVNTSPDNPVIGVRSFGSDAELVARHVAAFVRGLRRGGVASCAKHFPGHGDTHQDSHLELPTARLDERALLPFRAAADAGVDCVMTAHIRVPELGDEPATINPRAIGLLRDHGFDGVVMTDALEMRGIAALHGMGEAAVLALSAGADALCLGADVDDSHVARVVEALADAVREARLAEDRLAEAAARVGRVSDTVSDTRGLEETRSVGLEAARRALEIDGETALEPGRPTLVVECRPAPSIAAGPAGPGLGEVLTRRAPGTRVLVVEKSSLPLARSTGRDGTARHVVVLRDAHRHPWQRATAEGLPDAIVVETGLPVWRPARYRAYLATHGAGRVNLEAAAEALAGDFTVS